MIDPTALYQAAFTGGLVLACLLETFAPARKASAGPSPWRWFNNLALTAINYVLLVAVTPLVYLWLLRGVDVREIGLFHRVGLHPAAAFVVLLLAVELVGYWIHRASHRWSWLWRLHAVHHSDTELDFSTAHRHHPLEALISVAPGLAIVALLGPELEVLLAVNMTVAVLNALSHANMSWGAGMNRALNWVLVTPDFHRVHHSAEQRRTNSHYGTTLPLFDHLFGTASPLSDAPPQSAPLGLEYLREPGDSRLDRLLLQPLRVPQAMRSKKIG